jgi:predicted dehydrogenase
MYFIIGLGSMGRRRVRCLLANGVRPEQIVGFDRREDRRQEAKQKHGVLTTERVEDLVKDEIKAVFVSVWPNAHTRYCLMAAEAKKHWFCEVPLAMTLADLDRLMQLTTQNKLLGAVGSQMIFHPGSIQMKDWLNQDATGGLVTGWGVCTSYFPTWHPYEDYRQFYVSDKSAGGANIDMLGHELQWMCWLLNQDIVAVNSRTSFRSNLELTPGSYDTADILIEFANGFTVNMHFDGINRGLDRGLWLVGNDSTIHWDLHGPKAYRFDSNENTYKGYGPDEFEYEQAYVREIGYFINCVAKNDITGWPVKFEQALNVIRFISAVDESAARNGVRVSLS